MVEVREERILEPLAVLASTSTAFDHVVPVFLWYC